MLKKWIVEDPRPLSFCSDIGVSPIVSSMLRSRGVTTPEEALSYINPSLQSMTDPSQMAGVARSVERIRQAVSNCEKILIYGDYDADGVTGSSIVYLALREIGAEPTIFIPDRVQDGYGLKQAALERVILGGATLVITVDNGITGAREIAFLASKRIDCIVVDHHEVKGERPAAHAIIDGSPASDPETGPPPDADLAACGLAFKLAWALLGLEKAKKHLDVAAIGTVADMAPLVGENRRIVRFGLIEAGKSSKPGLRALLEVVGIHGTPTAEEVAFQIAPRINAAGRMGSAQDAVRLLVTDSPTEAGELAEILDRANTERQKLEKKAFREAVAEIEVGHHFGHDPVIVVASPRWHEGLVGILATRLVEKYYRPAFAISLKNGIGKGSGRSIADFLLFETMTKCADVFESFGGHQAACGLTIQEGRISEFKKSFNEIAKAALRPEHLVPRLIIDAEMSLANLDEALVSELDILEPFGIASRRPLFVARGVRVKTDQKKSNDREATLWIEDPRTGRGAEASCYRRKLEFKEGEIFDLVYSAALRRHKAGVSILLNIEDADVSC